MKKFILLLFLIGCGNPEDTTEAIPEYFSEQIIQFDAVGDELLSHIGYESVVLDNGVIVLPDRELSKLLMIKPNGELVKILGGKGRGPGEFQDISSVSGTQDNRVLVYDQMNKKIVEFDINGELTSEFLVPEGAPSGSLTDLYGIDSDQLVMLFVSNNYLFDPKSEQVSFLASYDRESGEYSEIRRVRSEPYAVIEGGGGAVRVPFAPSDRIFFDRYTSKVYSFYSGENKIAHLTESLDTAKIQRVELDQQKITQAEIDSLSKEFEKVYWDAIKPALPEYKATAEKVMAGPGQSFWFKLNDPGPTDQWLVADSLGKTQLIVHLPAKSMLTHISRDHLGVRLDDTNFAFFSYPEELLSND